MKHLRIKTRLFRRAALTLLLAVAGITNASAAASWVGSSAIYVNGTWYYAGTNFDWCAGGAFDGIDLGSISSLSLGGQSQNHEDGNDNGGTNWKGGTVTMYYKIDGGEQKFITLQWTNYGYGEYNNNNFFQSGGSNFTTTPIDISGLIPGNHTIEVYFWCDNAWDSNNSNNYKATFTINEPVSNPTAKKAPDGNYWATFYCGDADYKINDNVSACAYTATINNAEGTLTLHKIEKNIPKGTAVIIVAEGDGTDESVSITLNNASNLSFSGQNDLRGVDFAHTTSSLGTGTFYVLGSKTVGSEKHFGFHEYVGTNMPAHKAYLLVSSGNNTRGFTIEFENDGTTGIRTIDNGLTDNESWYSLDGRKFNGKPTSKGVYINNGKKVILK